VLSRNTNDFAPLEALKDVMTLSVFPSDFYRRGVFPLIDLHNSEPRFSDSMIQCNTDKSHVVTAAVATQNCTGVACCCYAGNCFDESGVPKYGVAIETTYVVELTANPVHDLTFPRLE
jgi:hypothetical protein